MKAVCSYLASLFVTSCFGIVIGAGIATLLFR